MNASQLTKAINFFYDHADHRIRDKPFMGSPYAIVSAYLIYVVLIVKILPKFMESREPLNYKKLMLIADVILCARSFYFLLISMYGWVFYAYNWRCQPMIDQPGSWESVMEVKSCYEFFITKFLYTFQSVVFVTSKKKSSVATYLLIHHSTFPLFIWIGINYYPGGHSTFIGFINAIVHFTVTGMRILSTAFSDGSFPKYAKIVDVYMHIFQFLALMLHSGQVLLQPDCSVPKPLAVFEVAAALYIAIIYNHYVLHSKKKESKKSD